jgi:hypothetical protein
MPDPNQPTSDDLAAELDEIETASEPETAPAPDTAPEAPAEPAPTPESPPDRTIAPPSAAQAKKAADAPRRATAIAAAPPTLSPVSEAEEKRRAGIQEKLGAVQVELDGHLKAIEDCRTRSRELMAELYPHTAESDSLVDAVRGHIAAQKTIRANRASNPERIAEILKAAGKAPIDAAFHRQRARGMARPTRNLTPPASGQGDGSNAKAAPE